MICCLSSVIGLCCCFGGIRLSIHAHLSETIFFINLINMVQISRHPVGFWLYYFVGNAGVIGIIGFNKMTLIFWQNFECLFQYGHTDDVIYFQNTVSNIIAVSVNLCDSTKNTKKRAMLLNVLSFSFWDAWFGIPLGFGPKSIWVLFLLLFPMH